MDVLLDNLRSAHNVGSIFRTADAAGISKISLAGITPGPIDRFGRENTRLTKVSLGAEKTIEWQRVENTEAHLGDLKAGGYSVLALEQSPKAKNLFSFDVTLADENKSILVIGPEVDGLSMTVLALADSILEIPMRGKKESLNVSVAFGIAAFHLLPSIATN